MLPNHLFQYLFPQLLRFAERTSDTRRTAGSTPLTFELLAQHHVAHMDRVRQDRLFGQFFQSSRGIVVVHTDIVGAIAEFDGAYGLISDFAAASLRLI